MSDGTADTDTADPGTEPRHGPPTEAVLFFGIAGFTAIIGVIYAVTTAMSGEIEPAGSLVLFGTAAFALWFGVFLLLMVRRVQGDVEALEEMKAGGDDRVDDAFYLPTHSIWPLGLAAGLSLMLAGVALGLWVLIPGIALFAHSLIGFAHQTRMRT
jgi:hypothetical protein